MAALKYAVVIANIRQKNQPLVVPKPYRNNRACGVDCTRLPNFPPHGLEMRASRARWRPARCTRSCKLLLFVFFSLFSNVFSFIHFAATTFASISSSFNLESREDVKAHMSFFYSASRPRLVRRARFARS